MYNKVLYISKKKEKEKKLSLLHARTMPLKDQFLLCTESEQSDSISINSRFSKNQLI